MKKILTFSLIAVSLAAANMSYASPYIGFGLGYTSAKITSHEVNTGTSINTKATSSLDGFNSLLFAGYNRRFKSLDDFNLGGEVNFTGYDVSSSWHNIGSTGNIKNELIYSYGIDILPGFYIADNVNLFVIGGYQNGYFKFKQNGANTTYNKKKTLGAYDFGLGTNITLANNFALRLMYKYTRFGGTKIRVGDTFTATKKPQSNQFVIGIIYNFV